MNNTINLQLLVESVAKSTSTENSFVEKFIRTLFESITDSIAEGEQIEVPGIGIFGCESLGGQTNIVWQPDSSLADEINTPFSSFEPVVLAQGLTEDMLNQSSTTSDQDEAPEEVQTEDSTLLPPPIIIPPIPTDSQSQPTEQPEAQTEVETTTEPTEEPSEETPQEPTEETPEETESDISDPDQQPSSGGMGWWIFAIAIAAILGYLFATFCPNPIQNYMNATDDEDEEPIETIIDDTISSTSIAKEEISDSVIPVAPVTIEKPATQTSPTVVTDTVRKDRFLATMARQYYGSYKFWVYIYLENSDKIHNPNDLPVGTVVVIPPAEKYGINAADPASISRAEAEIRRIEKR